MLTLQELVEENVEENKYRMREIQRLQAFYLFAQHNFEKSLEIYTKIDAGVCVCVCVCVRACVPCVRACVCVCVCVCVSIYYCDVCMHHWEHFCGLRKS